MDHNKATLWQDKADRLLRDIAQEEHEYTRLLALKEETEIQAWRMKCEADSLRKLVN
jgi:hypothetical protein